MEDVQKVIADVRRWVEQERLWDNSLIGTSVEREPLIEKKASVAAVAPATSMPAARSAGPAKAAALQALYEKYKDCTRCDLGLTRIKIVFGVGNPDSEVLFIGEGPGYEEDRRGEPFVGKAGQLLDKMMAAIGLSRQTNAYIANIVKCHPMANPQTPEARGNDRAPNPEEVETCSPILLSQIAIMKPRFIVTLGSPSSKMILRTKDGITGLRGKFFPFAVDAFYPQALVEAPGIVAIDPMTREALNQTQVLPTYHPAALLRNPNLKPESWSDLKLLREALAK
jgi:DNA polymerase